MDVQKLYAGASTAHEQAVRKALYGDQADDYQPKEQTGLTASLHKAAETYDAATPVQGLNPAVDQAQAKQDFENDLRALFVRRCPRLESLNVAARDPQPEPLIKPSDGCGSLLAAGEIMLLAGAGGAGKSTLACQLAVRATQGEAGGWANGSDWADVAGLRVRAGRVVILSYEDRRWRVWKRCQRIGKAAGLNRDLQSALDQIGIVDAEGWPLFGIPEGGHIGQAPERLDVWPHLWAKIADWKPSIVVIDPALCSFNSDDSRVAAVRAFLDALRNEAAQIDAGVVVVAHTTKAARNSGDGPLDPGAVSGSAAWTDAARTALLLQRKPSPNSKEANTWELVSIKANYCGPFRVELEALNGPDGELAGFKITTNQGGADDNWA